MLLKETSRAGVKSLNNTVCPKLVVISKFLFQSESNITF
jgi:hypothetical protein